MKKLKFFAFALVAAFGFAACDSKDEEFTYEESTVVMGGSQSSNGSFFTFDKGVQTKTGLGDSGANVVFCFSTIDDNFQFISGTEATNEIVKATASETKFAVIGDATAAKFEKAVCSETKVEISNKLESGKKAVAFENANCKGFFEVVSYDAEKQDLTLKVWIQKAAEVAE